MSQSIHILSIHFDTNDLNRYCRVCILYRCTNLVVTLSHHNFVAKLIPSGAYWIQSTTNCTLVLVRNCALVHFISFPRNSIVRLKTKGGGKGGDKVSAMSFPAPRGNGE